MSTPRRYAQRRVNPFLGVLQVIDTPGGRALSPDGINWEIQLYAERPAGWGSLNTAKTERMLYRYGVWSSDDGLARFPAPPTVDRAEARTAGDALVAAARESAALLPFPLADHCELWLLDDTGDAAPLALLDAVTEARGVDHRRVPAWTCAPADAPGLEAQERASLEAQVRARAGQSHRSRWFRREPGGAGVELGTDDTDAGVPPRRLEAERFPELLISEDWTSPEAQARTDDYIAWQAPRLLMLPMTPETRERLEKAAAKQALVVDRFHRLYPEITDSEWIVRLRVEARLRRGRGPSDG
jgi:hypothetical protein